VSQGLREDARAAGTDRSVDALLASHYDEFRLLARKLMRRERASPIQPTELAHEAAMRLMRLERLDLASATHFLAMSVRVMRQILVDEARRARAKKRSAPPVMTEWPDPGGGGRSIDIEALDEALERLAHISAERARVVELRFFAGLTMDEIAREVGASVATVNRRWAGARAWLLHEMRAE
jgi:RNA polymerase sigma factor (TIGR02999 family)